MTESEWLTSEDPAAMLRYITHPLDSDTLWNRHGLKPPNDRKLRLFACACCRQVWHLLTDPRSRKAVEVAERYADGLATEQEVRKTLNAAMPGDGDHMGELAHEAVICLDSPPSYHVPRLICGLSERLSLAAQAALLRDIIGNPFRPVVVGVTGTPQKMLGHLLGVTKTSSLGGMAIYDAIPRERKLNDARLSSLAEALHVAYDEDRNQRHDRRGLTLTHWHTGNGHLSSSFQFYDPSAKPGEPMAWEIYLKNTIAERVIRQHADDLLAPSWLTPLVRQLAETAYTERLTVPCVACEGSGYHRDDWFPGDEGRESCNTCHGTGRSDTGQLDPGRLGILADACEEAGCQDEAILRHLRGQELCLKCGGAGAFRGDGLSPCDVCGYEGWRPLRAPHYRGCYVLDALLGRS